MYTRYKGELQYYPWKITRCCSDGTHDILYDNGEHEFVLENKMIFVYPT